MPTGNGFDSFAEGFLPISGKGLSRTRPSIDDAQRLSIQYGNDSGNRGPLAA
jgi:hypothetical protein